MGGRRRHRGGGRGGGMTIRLNMQQAEAAAHELIEILTANPAGMRTSALRGTPKFHGGRTLTNRQIIRLLRASPEFASHELQESVGGQGMYTYSWWTLRKNAEKAAA